MNEREFKKVIFDWVNRYGSDAAVEHLTNILSDTLTPTQCSKVANELLLENG